MSRTQKINSWPLPGADRKNATLLDSHSQNASKGLSGRLQSVPDMVATLLSRADSNGADAWLPRPPWHRQSDFPPLEAATTVPLSIGPTKASPGPCRRCPRDRASHSGLGLLE